ncbi:TetR/AcrR family transcriptional regulator [Streptomyces sp. NBC_01341]|uniref:TetR/AcrR family transcriptional regulator n=1 Tax=Streptomyces sp. NBC_01341 TaxID=2903831 RepID=UPI002E138F4B|nr:TetR/AcrR family transcriptional regulator [Streptomyces sp. NBC_01341]
MPPTNRADALRNRALLLAAAGEVIAEHGTNASLRDVARRAGVGIGTLYRHFPNREVLLEALLDANFDALRARADGLLASPDPEAALLAWLEEMAAGSATYQGLPESIMDALANEESGLHEACDRMKSAGGRLLERAQEAGSIRPELTIRAVIAVALGLSWAAQYASDLSEQVGPLLRAAIVASGARE